MAGFGFNDTYEALYDLLGEDFRYDQVARETLRGFYDRSVDGDHRSALYDRLCEWMADEYALDFENWLDWDEFRAWYNGSD